MHEDDDRTVIVVAHERDIDRLRRVGWEVGAYWSAPGASGWYVCHRRLGWVRVRVTPDYGDRLAGHVTGAMRRRMEAVRETLETQ